MDVPAGGDCLYTMSSPRPSLATGLGTAMRPASNTAWAASLYVRVKRSGADNELEPLPLSDDTSAMMPTMTTTAAVSAPMMTLGFVLRTISYSPSSAD